MSEIEERISSIYYRISKYDMNKIYTHEDLLKMFFFIMAESDEDYESACKQCGFKSLEANI